MKTLHGYIGRDLAKITILALFAFTLLMTVFAIIEPLRKYGLEADKALGLIGYTLPMMMSLTLPIAALFAATIVYGRFSQDNEMTACRASGISTIMVLRPALVLGGMVTVISLFLSSFVTPQILRTVETAIKANVRSIAYQQLRAKSGVRWKGKGLLIHADRVDPQADKIYGLVVARRDRETGEVQFVVAPEAKVEFSERDGDTELTFYLKAAAPASTRRDFYDTAETSLPPQSVTLPNLTKEDPSWYDWPKLLRTLRNPSESREIRKALERIRLTLCYDMLGQAVASTINKGQPFTRLHKAGREYSYQLRASRAVRGAKGTVLLRSGGPGRPVAVSVIRKGQPYQLITAKRGMLQAGQTPMSSESFITIRLTDDVKISSVIQGRSMPQKRSTWEAGQILIPKELTQKSQAIPLTDIVLRAGELTNDQNIIRKITNLQNLTILRLINKIKAEMHMRAAYGVSCFLMVAMGAAVGLMLRGGQVISAFAISVVPASLVIVMMMMGKQMVRNPDVSVAVGLAGIWVGVVALLAADVVIYAYLMRK